MKALSIRPAWAHLIIRPDITDPIKRWNATQRGILKLIENRTWATSYRGKILVHASKSMTKAEYADAMDMLYRVTGSVPDSIPSFDDMPRGGIIGSVQVVGCLPPEEVCSGWRMPGHFGFQLHNPQPLPFRPMRGQLGFFEVPEE